METYEKLKQLEEWGYEFRNVRITFVDETSVICIPQTWDYEEDGSMAYTVRLVEPYDKYPAGVLYQVQETDIKSQQVVQ